MNDVRRGRKAGAEVEANGEAVAPARHADAMDRAGRAARVGRARGAADMVAAKDDRVSPCTFTSCGNERSNAGRHPHRPLRGSVPAEPSRNSPRDTIARLPSFLGHAEHAALMTAMDDETPASDGLDVFTGDLYSAPEGVTMMRGSCRSCPLLELY